MVIVLLCYSFLTKSAKIKRIVAFVRKWRSYSFLTKSAKIKQTKKYPTGAYGYSFLTKSAKIKPPPCTQKTTPCAIVSLQNRLK